jgi:hypothetical protein
MSEDLARMFAAQEQESNAAMQSADHGAGVDHVE